MAYTQARSTCSSRSTWREHLDKIELYLGQVCAIAGISKMQLDYWTNKAQIPTKGKKQRIYDMRRGRDRDADQAGARTRA